jgi:hypothetical protein
MSEYQKRLRAVVRDAVDASKRPARDLEREIGLGTGNLARLLDGRLEIRLHHLLGLAGVLRVPPADFVELGFPEAASTAKHRLSDWLRPAPSEPPVPASVAAATTTLPASSAAALADVVREVVREELARQQSAASAATP